jgi:two-component system, cell cycle sensor histidine kinase and response regulator CckA
MSETILLVEDNLALLAAVRRLLERTGYLVLAASSVSEAIELAANVEEPIDLLLSDYLLPSATGRQLAQVLRRTQPRLRVLFMSGYSGQDLQPEPDDDVEAAFVQKPFAAEQLLIQIRAVLHPRRRRNDAVG